MNEAYDMLVPQTDEEVIDVDLSSDLIEIGVLFIDSISLDGNPLVADKNGNLDIPVGVAEINRRLDELEKGNEGDDADIKTLQDRVTGVENDIASKGVISLPPMTQADKGKVLLSNGSQAIWEDVINAVPYEEVENSAGGTTVVIGG